MIVDLQILLKVNAFLTFPGISKILPSLVSSLEFCSFKLERLLKFPELLLEEWEGLNEKINEMKSQLDASLNVIGTVPQYIDVDSGS